MTNKKLNARTLKPKKDAGETIRSALALAELVLSSEKVSTKHKKDVLHHVLWKLTEAKHPKHRLPLRTRAAHDEILKGGDLGKRLRHEHVFPRSSVVNEIMDNPKKVRRLLKKNAVACIVTKQEAESLTAQDRRRRKAGKPKLLGWDRYKTLRLRVIEVQQDGTLKDPAQSP